MRSTKPQRRLVGGVTAALLGISAALVALGTAAPAIAAPTITAPVIAAPTITAPLIAAPVTPAAPTTTPAPGPSAPPPTVTALIIPVTQVVDLTSSNSAVGDFQPLPVSGSVAFPLTFSFGGEASHVYFRASGFRSDATVPAGCTRMVDGFTVSINDVSEPGQAVQGVMTDGIPNALSSGIVSEYSGTGVLNAGDFGALVNFSNVGGPHHGTLSMSYADQVPWAEAFPVVGLSAMGNNVNDPDGPVYIPVRWTIGSAYFAVTDTCSVSPPQPSTAPPTSPAGQPTATVATSAHAEAATLAHTGNQVAPLSVFAVLSLVFGVGAAVIVRRRQRLLGR